MNIDQKKYNENFLKYALPIIEHDAYQSMKTIPHHDGSVYEHCLDVAYFSFRMSSFFRLDTQSTVRGALLHDFYLYKFKKRENKNLIAEGYRHSKNHPKIAMTNALQYFELNAKEKDIISNHMFPVGLPRCYEAWIITFADKTLAIREYSTRAIRYVNNKIRSTYSPQVIEEAE